MKNFVKLVIGIALLVYYSGCQKVQHIELRQEIVTKENSVFTDTIYSILKEYLYQTKEAKGVVHQMFINQFSDSVVVYLSFSQFEDIILKNKPSGYFKIGKNLIVIYTGLELVLNNDESFTKRLLEELRNFPLKNRPQTPTILKFSYWSITIDNTKGELEVNKKANFPFTKLIVDIDTLSQGDLFREINKKEH